MMTSTKLTFLLVFLSGLLFAQSGAESVIHYQGKDATLQQRWEWAQETARTIDGSYWIGYALERQMQQNSYIGMFHSREAKRFPILGRLIYGRYTSIHSKDTLSVRDAARLALDRKKRETEKILVQKKIGFLFRFDQNRHPVELRVSTLDMEFDTKDAPVFWLGRVNESESADLLIGLFDTLPEKDGQERALMAMGWHKKSTAAGDFIAAVCRSERSDDLREKAIFWLGHMADDRWLPIFKDIINTDASESVRQKAVFAISQMDTESALEILAELARNHKDEAIRKKALFWLAHEAQHKSLQTIVDITYNDESTALQTYAVYVLAEINKGDNLPLLIDIAKNHPNREVRKKAIFWLGQKDDPQAIEAIISLVKMNN